MFGSLDLFRAARKQSIVRPPFLVILIGLDHPEWLLFSPLYLEGHSAAVFSRTEAA
jgi:hypothetical protein